MVPILGQELGTGHPEAGSPRHVWTGRAGHFCKPAPLAAAAVNFKAGCLSLYLSPAFLFPAMSQFQLLLLSQPLLPNSWSLLTRLGRMEVMAGTLGGPPKPQRIMEQVDI